MKSVKSSKGTLSRASFENKRAMHYSEHESPRGSIDLDWLPLSQGILPKRNKMTAAAVALFNHAYPLEQIF